MARTIAHDTPPSTGETQNSIKADRQVAIELSTASVQIPEGGQASFNVRLTARPEAKEVRVTVRRASGDADITVASGATLTFLKRRYNQWQAVTLQAAEDADSTDGQAVFLVSGVDLTAARLTATEKDKGTQPQDFQIVMDRNRIDVAEGGSARFNVRLSANPAGPVSVTVGHYQGDADISVAAGGTLSFNGQNWDVDQPVTLAAAEDDDNTNGEAVFALSAPGAQTVYLTAVEQDGGGSEPSGRVVIDPVSRIEGHLRVEVEVSGGQVSKAWSSATLFRGIETILAGRDPRDAPIITQRLCGVCTYVHQLCSVRAIEDAAGVIIPDNARLVRNLTLGAQFLHDHIVHFFHLHGLDWVDVTSALGADPEATADLAAAATPGADPIDFAAVKARLQTLVGTGNLGPFANAYWGHADYMLSPEENLLVTAHYLKALEVQVVAARMMAILGGKNPHPQSTVVGGVTCGAELNADRLAAFRGCLEQTRRFVDTVYLPDLKVVAARYPEWTGIGGHTHFLACGEFPQSAATDDLFMPAGVILNGDLSRVEPLNEALISEHVARSWYAGTTDRHPLSGETNPAYTSLNVDDRYSWFKAPRYDGSAMEVGPLARVLVGYASGRSEFVQAVENFLGDTGILEIDLLSALGRTAARGIETQIIASGMNLWLQQLQGNLDSGDTRVYTDYSLGTHAGRGLLEAPRGALGHWIDIRSSATSRYQMVVPTTWNLGPRCAGNIPGPLEQALVGIPVADAQNPVEILRVIHSFDPCVACGVHVIDRDGNRTFDVKVV